jgi:DNA-binding NarL/FixJ family response regulator
MTRRPCRPAKRATEREVGVVAAVLAAGSEKAAAHRLGLSHSTVKHHLANARSKLGAERRRSWCGSWRLGCRSRRVAGTMA